MGNHQSQNDIQALRQRYTLVDEIDDLKYGHCQVLKENTTKQLILMKIIHTVDQQIFNSNMKLYKTRSKLDHANFLKINEVIGQEEQEYCSQFYKFFILFNCINNNLQKEFNSRQVKSNNFSEPEIWSIITGTISGLAFLQKDNTTNQNLKAENIYINDDGIIKIMDPTILNLQTNFQEIMTNPQDNHAFTYLSPQLVKAIQQNQIKPKHNQFKSDVFTLGVIILQCIFLEPNMVQIYNYHDGTINRYLIDDYLNTIQKTYQNHISSTLNLMLQYEENERYDFIQLEQYASNQKVLQLIKEEPNQESYETPEQIKRHGKRSKNLNKHDLIPKQKDQVDNGSTVEQLIANNNTVERSDPHIRHNISYKADPQVIYQNNEPLINRNQYQNENIPYRTPDIQKYTTPELQPEQKKYSNLDIDQIVKKYKKSDISPITYEIPESNNSNPQTYKVNQFQNPDYSIYSSTQNPTYPPYISTQNNSKIDVQQILQKYDYLKSKNSRYEDNNHTNNNYQPQPLSDRNQFTNSQYIQKPSNIVKEKYQNGSQYEGQKADGMREGKGKFYYLDGGIYDGMWHLNKMHGKGTLYYADGSPAYSGDWIDDKFQGKGVIYNESPVQLNQPFNFRDFDQIGDYWTKYDGEFQDDNKEGFGTLYLTNGEKFSGIFSKDYICGQGTYYKLDRTSFTGNWYNNKLN